MSDTSRLLRIDDLDDVAVDQVLAAAATGAVGRRRRGTAGLVFLSPSLRTRVGFAVAGARIGLVPVHADAARFDSSMSAGESVEDTIRTVAGMTDVVVVRAPVDLVVSLAEIDVRVPVVNGGDLIGHPTQALIDLHAIRTLVGPEHELRITMAGDLTMRASRSLLRLFARFPPRELRLIAPLSRTHHGVSLDAVALTGPSDLEDALPETDVLLLTGLAPGQGDDLIGEQERQRYALTGGRLGLLPRDATVLSPLPLIDEMDSLARRDARFKAFSQSDLGLHVRVAVLDHVLG